MHIPTSIRRFTLAAGLAAALCGSAPAVAAPPAPTISLAEVPELAGLADRWQEAMGDFGVPGLAVAIVRPGRPLVLATFGIRDAEGEAPVTPETMFYIASVTKTYLATLVAALAEDGRLDLDAPVRRYLPQLKLADEALAATVTVRDLLCHRHGINHGGIVWLDAFTGQITESDYFRLLAEAEAAGQIGYSNVHFTLAGRVVEAVTGRPWQEVLQERLLDRAGLDRTTASASRLFGDADHAEPMVNLGGRWQRLALRKTDRTMHAAGGMGTSIRDAARWLELFIGGGALDGAPVVAPATMNDLLAFHSLFAKPKGRIRVDMGFALGWQRGTYRPDGPVQYRHGGSYEGTAAEFTFLPERGIGVAVLANAGAGNPLAAMIEVDVLDRLLHVDEGTDLLPDYRRQVARLRERTALELPNGPAPSRQLGLSVEPALYVGRYRHADQGVAEIMLVDGGLAGRIGDLPLALHVAAVDSFRVMMAPGMISEGRFEVAEGEVRAVWLRGDGDGVVRFGRE